MSLKPKQKLLDIREIIPSDAKFVDFEVEKEDWARYRLADHSILKAKLVVSGFIFDKTMEEIRNEAKALKPDQHLTIGFAFRSQRIFSVDPPMELRGKPDERKYSIEDLKSSIIETDIDFETVKLTWNSYLLDDGIKFKCRLTPTIVNRTSKFDNIGIPIYFVDSNVDVKVTLPEDIIRMIERKRKASKKQRRVKNQR